MSRSRSSSLLASVAAGLVALPTGLRSPHDLFAQEAKRETASPATLAHRTVKVNSLDIFFREAGRKDAPAILLLHGFPTSSAMFRNLIPALAGEYHPVAPD
jgi:hypothetical protein